VVHALGGDVRQTTMMMTLGVLRGSRGQSKEREGDVGHSMSRGLTKRTVTEPNNNNNKSPKHQPGVMTKHNTYKKSPR